MNAKLVAGLFAFLECLLLAGQVTTLISTYWTSWDLRFNWTQSMHVSKPSQADGQLVSQGHAGLWSRCVRVFDASREDASSSAYECLQNYNTSNGSLRFTFGKACKTATAALCIGDVVIIITILIIILLSACRKSKSVVGVRTALPLLLLQGLVCFVIPLAYLSGNMAELIDQLSGAYGLLLIVRMTPWYTHDWAFWTQVGLFVIWTIAVAIFVIIYSWKYALSCPKTTKITNGNNERANSAELEALKS